MEKKKILVIEDDAMMRRIFERLLSQEAFDVELIQEGSNVIEQLTNMKEKPSAITLDLMMSGVSGLEVLAFLKQNPEWASIPVAVVTNMAGKESLETVKQLGADLYIVKSENDLSQIVAKIHQLLGIPVAQ